MFLQLIDIFVTVITPVFSLVGIGYVAGPRLKLEARTLSRSAYYLFIPAFVFDVISKAQVEAGELGRMVGLGIAIVLVTAMLGAGVALLLRRPKPVIAAFALIASFGNVGNFGLPLIEFRLGGDALIPATIYFLTISLSAFVVGVGAAGYVRGGGLSAALSVLKTPALLAMIPAFFFARTGAAIPLPIERIISLLAAAMIPVMLVALGVQLASSTGLRLERDVWVASGARLLGGPVAAALLALIFGVEGASRATAIVQSGMPAAVLTSIIALEYDLLPDFVTSTVLFSTLASVLTLTLLLAMV
ncbi:MAG TPA: AEC family transporter [Anaerolineae bacterium]|nr:AEC family transporter [Caldilineae bacterium]HID33725.1 AEC family transporter [Anaerolineae bacterium]